MTSTIFRVLLKGEEAHLLQVREKSSSNASAALA